MKKLFQYLHQKESNVILLQETHSTKKIERRRKTEWGGSIYYSHGTSAARGVSILIKRKCKIKDVLKDKVGQFLALDIDYEGPNEDCPEFFMERTLDLEKFQNEQKIIGSDFNLVSDLDLDKVGGRATTHTNWSSAGRSFVMRSLNPCPEIFDQNVVVWGKLPRGGGGGNYQRQTTHIGSLG